jgi:hypothetical protein
LVIRICTTPPHSTSATPKWLRKSLPRYSSLAVCLVAVVISVVYTGDLLTLVVPKQISNNRRIPTYFKVGVNEEEARRRWEATLQWRELQDVDSLLANPPDNYELIAQV